MRLKEVLWIVVFLISLNLVVGEYLECQYKTTLTYNEEVEKLYNSESGSEFGGALNFSNFVKGTEGTNGMCITSFDIKNPFDMPITVSVEFDLIRSTYPERLTRSVRIQPSSFKTVEERVLNSKRCWVNDETYTYYLLSPSLIIPKTKNVSKIKTTCKMCREKICKNDGEKCRRDRECGSDNCVDRICSPTSNCPNNDCGCSKNEIQCDNSFCVKKGKLNNGETPKCSPEECKSGNIDSTFTCSDQTEEEKPIASSSEKDEDVPEAFEKSESDFSKIAIASLIIVAIIIFILVKKGNKSKYKDMDNNQLEDEERILRRQIEEEQENIKKDEEDIIWLKDMKWFEETDKIKTLKEDVKRRKRILRNLSNNYTIVLNELEKRKQR